MALYLGEDKVKNIWLDTSKVRNVYKGTDFLIKEEPTGFTDQNYIYNGQGMIPRNNCAFFDCGLQINEIGEIDMVYDTSSSSTRPYLFGAYSSSSKFYIDGLDVYYNSSGRVAFDTSLVGENSHMNIKINWTSLDVSDPNANSLVVTLNGQTQTKSIMGLYNPGVNLTLCKINGSSFSYLMARVRSLTIRDRSGVILRSYDAKKRNSDSKYGMWDYVHHEFKTSEGSIQFGGSN